MALFEGIQLKTIDSRVRFLIFLFSFLKGFFTHSTFVILFWLRLVVLICLPSCIQKKKQLLAVLFLYCELFGAFFVGVTPLDSVREEEEDGNVSSDSVFNYDQNQELFRSYHPAYYNHLPLPPPPTLLVNNNTIPHSSNRQQSGKTSK